MSYYCPKCGKQVSGSESRCPACGCRLAPVTLEDTVIDGAIDYATRWNGEPVGIIKSTVLGVVQGLFIWLVLTLLNEFLFKFENIDWLWGLLGFFWALFVMYITGPYRYWNWRSILKTSPWFFLSVALCIGIMYVLETFFQITVGIWIFLIPIAVWWIANKLNQIL